MNYTKARNHFACICKLRDSEQSTPKGCHAYV